jgi:hypothetical protein
VLDQLLNRHRRPPFVDEGRTVTPRYTVKSHQPISCVAPGGYYKVEGIEACEKAGIVPHVPRPQRGAAVREGLFRKDEFRYDATSDTYLCPAGQRLEPRYQSTAARNLTKVDYCNREACRACPLRPRCTHNSYRRVTRLENEAVLDRTEARLAARPELLDQRREIVEHPFGTIKHWMTRAPSSCEVWRTCGLSSA